MKLNRKKTVAAPEHVDPAALDKVERWFDAGGSVAQTFKESLDAGGVVLSDFMRVIAGSSALLTLGLDREAMAVLVQMKCAKAANGQPISVDTVAKVLAGIERLPELLNERSRAKVTKVIAETVTKHEDTDAVWATLSPEQRKKLLAGVK